MPPNTQKQPPLFSSTQDTTVFKIGQALRKTEQRAIGVPLGGKTKQT